MVPTASSQCRGEDIDVDRTKGDGDMSPWRSPTSRVTDSGKSLGV
jgi:hypothetical protein